MLTRDELQSMIRRDEDAGPNETLADPAAWDRRRLLDHLAGLDGLQISVGDERIGTVRDELAVMQLHVERARELLRDVLVNPRAGQ